MFLLLFSFAGISFANKLPSSIQKKIPVGWSVKDSIKGLLNDDGEPDLILVLEDKKDEQVPRKLMIFFANKGVYSLTGVSDTVVYCEKCGGVFGDPYGAILIDKRKITVNNYGGSNWRWGNEATFAYSRIDKQWQLVKIEKSSFHTSDPEKIKILKKLPNNFGKISLEKFNPERI